MPKPVQHTKTSKKSVVDSKSVADKLRDAIFEDLDEYMKILIYGKSKTGKTRTAATFPGPILWLISSGSIKSGELKSLSKEDRKKVHPYRIDSTSEILEVLELVPVYDIKTIVMDHLTGLQDKAMCEVLGVEELPAQMGWGVATMQQWQQGGGICRENLRKIINTDCNVVILAQENEPKETEDDGFMVPSVSAAVMPSLRTWVTPTVDYICQTFKKQKIEKVKTTTNGKDRWTEKRVDGADYCLRTGPHEVYQTGFRLPRGARLPDFIIDPSYEKIKRIADGEWKA